MINERKIYYYYDKSNTDKAANKLSGTDQTNARGAYAKGLVKIC